MERIGLGTDADRVQISARHSPLLHDVFWPVVFGAAFVTVGALVRARGGVEAPLGVALIILPLLCGLAWWRWGTPLRCVMATHSGLLVFRGKRELFVPYGAVASTRQTWLRGGASVVTVSLRAPVAELRRFAFVPAKVPGFREGIEHPIVTELVRKVESARHEGTERVDSDLSEAIVLYVGYEVSNCPRLERSRLHPKFGEDRARKLEEQIGPLLAELGKIEVNWATHDLVTGSALARDAMRTRHPELSERALDALEWKFSYDWK